MSESTTETEQEANARLIAAAPDLLAALKIMVGWESAGLYEKDAIRDFDREHAHSMARAELSDAILGKSLAAIAKATGKG